MFFMNNGVNAIMYEQDNLDEADEDEKEIPESKLFQFIGRLDEKKLKICLVGTIAFFIGLNTYLISFINGNGYKLHQKIFPTDMNGYLASQLINDSSKLTDEQKELLSKKDSLDELIGFASDDRYYELYCKLNELNISTYGEMNPNYKTANGYYQSINENNIFINKGLCNAKEINDVITHEFIHLLQNNFCKYSYIHEACAEIMSHEYYGANLNAYTGEVKRTRVLMEIIGPKPVIDCNFNSDYSSFIDAIYKYLDKDDAKRLLKIFEYGSSYITNLSDEEYKNINAEIDDLLAKMYFNKYGTDIKNDRMIKEIYANNAPNRIYFNQQHQYFKNVYFYEGYNNLNDYSYDIVDSDYFDYITNKDNILKITYRKKNLYTWDYIEKNNLNDKINCSVVNILIDGAYSKLVPIEGYNADGNLGTINVYRIEYKDKLYTEDEALAYGICEQRYVIAEDKEIEDINDVSSPSDYDAIYIFGKDGSLCELGRQDGKWVPYRKGVSNLEFEPSIYEKFPEQFLDSKDITGIINDNTNNDDINNIKMR